MKKNRIKYKIYKESKIKALITKAKNLFKKNNRAFNMLKKGYNPKSDIVHRSIK